MTDDVADVQVADSVVEAPTSAPESMGAREAGRLLASLRKPKESKPVTVPAAAAAPVAEQESTAQAEDAAPPEQETTGETQETAPVEEPAIEPPRSWTKEARANWAKLDPDTQRFLLEQDSQTSATVKQRLNEAAEKTKAIEAERQKVEQARQQYESALPILMQNLQAAMAGEFSDIKSMQDVQRMAAEDWPRYIRWDAAQKQVAAVHQEVVAAQQRQQTEEAQKFADFARKEGELFVEKVPEMADPAKAVELQKAAMSSLKSAGFDEQELAQAWQGKINVPFRDHRVQLMIHKASLWDQAQAKAKAIVTQAKPIPPVQRPGAAQPKGAAQHAQIEALGKRLDNASGVRNQVRAAADLLRMRRAAR